MLRFAFYPRPPGGGRHQGISQKSNRVSDFYPRLPDGGRRAYVLSARKFNSISIHALRVEGDPTFLRGRSATNAFLSTPSGWRATFPATRICYRGCISIHALRVEGDRVNQRAVNPTNPFLSTPSGWRATICSATLITLYSTFLSTPSGWRATVVLVALFPRCFNFYPRPPGGGRPFCISKDICVYNFYPRPPGGGRLSHSMFPRTAETISIHALRVEGDKIAPFVKHLHYISIHALRVEGDKSIFDRLRRRIRNFYPRPPGGGRPSAFHPYTPAV